MYYLPEKFHTRDTYLNKGIAYLFGDTIYEYDMRSANLNLIIYYELLPQKTIDKIKVLDKDRRNKKIGVLTRDDKVLNEALKKAFADMRKIFYEENEIEPNDIIAVKKDAIFLRKTCEHTTFENVEFVVKNRYSSFVQIGGIELYYGNYDDEQRIDVKGINDDRIELHKKGILEFLCKLFRRIESDGTASAYRYLSKYVREYKTCKLPLEHYRWFDANSLYVEAGTGYKYDEYWDDRIRDLDITYNLNNVIIPLIMMLY